MLMLTNFQWAARCWGSHLHILIPTQQEIADRERKVLPIDLDDVAKVRTCVGLLQVSCAPSIPTHAPPSVVSSQFCADRVHPETGANLMHLLHEIERNTLYFVKLFAEAADDRMPEPSNPAYVNAQKDVYDVLIEQVCRHVVCESMVCHDSTHGWKYK